MVGKSWRQECEAADYVPFIVRKEREMSGGTQLTFPISFIHLRL